MGLNTPVPDSTDYIVGVLQFCENALGTQEPDLASIIGYAASELRKRHYVAARSVPDDLGSADRGGPGSTQ